MFPAIIRAAAPIIGEAAQAAAARSGSKILSNQLFGQMTNLGIQGASNALADKLEQRQAIKAEQKETKNG
jgi:hypothetical protein